MQFTNITKNNINDVYSIENQKKHLRTNTLLSLNRNLPNSPPMQVNEQQPINHFRPVRILRNPVNRVAPVEEEPKPKMLWGAPIWFLFHTLAEKVKEENFFQVKTDLLNNIFTICKNLPCPTCAGHATDYMNKINFNSIRTKQDLKMMLFNFHNSVNQRKNYTSFQLSELDEKYSKAITINIFNNFLKHFQDKHKSIRMISDDIYRKRIAANLKVWFSNNIQYFNP